MREIGAAGRGRRRRLRPRIERHAVVLEDERRPVAELDPRLDGAGRLRVIDDVGRDFVEDELDVVAVPRMQLPGIQDQAQRQDGVVEAGVVAGKCSTWSVFMNAPVQAPR